MAFELFKKQAGISSVPNNNVSVNKTCVVFGKDFIKLFEDNNYAEVYLDRYNNLVGFKPCNNKTTGYRVRVDKKSVSKPTISSPKLSSIFPRGRYEAKVDNEGLVVINVTEIYEQKE